ncbi:hypothetical protein IB270_33130 [Ensifer sp. ENS05]|uniref:hypothetical protein n=1 Tax=Ensifer sp. ENS05 TaxID=2769277 RepID=UPI00178243B9|nr:hypothetical protein [Ensifer sp. ENS05]MBD9597671.1 hypothetical protein [Ensifer sp. ENS05]
MTVNMEGKAIRDLSRIDLTPWQRVFRDVAIAILDADGFTPSAWPSYETRKMDRILEKGGVVHLVHFHHYDFRDVDARVIQNASNHLYNAMRNHGIRHGILVFSARRPGSVPSLWGDGENETIRLFGASDLQRLARHDTSLLGLLEDYMRRRNVELVGDTVVPLAGDAFDPTEKLVDGKALVAELNACRAGRAGAKAFEAICIKALNLIFYDQLDSLVAKVGVDEGLSYFDALGTLNTRRWTGFWQDLGTFFRCRYVVFEFKNYGKPIGQREITITAKYLNPKALRPVAIIIARNGEKENAWKSRLQQLRANGFVILTITGDDLAKMITRFDQGHDPSEVLSAELNRVMTSLPL